MSLRYSQQCLSETEQKMLSPPLHTDDDNHDPETHRKVLFNQLRFSSENSPNPHGIAQELERMFEEHI